MFKKANDAAQRDNIDYAFALFCQVLEREPALFECRKALRAAQFKKAGTGGTSFFRKVMSGTGNSPQIMKAKMALNKNPAEALAIAEQVSEWRPEQLRRAPHHRGRGARAGVSADRLFRSKRSSGIHPRTKPSRLNMPMRLPPAAATPAAVKRFCRISCVFRRTTPT